MSTWTASDGVRLNVEIAGRDDAPTVVLVHGLAASIGLAWSTTGVLARLAEEGLRTVAYDARGHGRSDAPHEPERYGDDRLAADLAEIVAAFAGPDAVVAGYSMGSATILVGLEAGLEVRGAAIGGTPKVVVGWTDDAELQRDTAVNALEAREEPGAVMKWWIDFLDATGVDKPALAAFLRGHRPVIEHWDRIAVPVVVAAGVDDPTAVASADLVARLRNGRALDLPGDHITAAAAPEFTAAIAALARPEA